MVIYKKLEKPASAMVLGGGTDAIHAGQSGVVSRLSPIRCVIVQGHRLSTMEL